MSVKPLISVEEFEDMAAELGPCELERGEVVHLSPGGVGHSTIAIKIAYYLTDWAMKSKRGRVLGCEAGLITERSPATVRGVDVAYISFERMPRGRMPDGFADVPPELVVEVVGKGQSWKKMLRKASEYFHMGVSRVWIVDPKTQRVHVLKPDDEPEVFDVRQTIADPQVLPGFRRRVRDFFDL